MGALDALVELNRTLGRKTGWTIRKYQADFATARQYLIQTSKIDLFVDGGANTGQWAKPIVDLYKSALVVSFEPELSSFNQLATLANHENWKVENCALGDSNHRAILRIPSLNTMASSLEKPTAWSAKVYPDIQFDRVQDVQVRRLDEFTFMQSRDIFLKLDVQGSELKALEGCGDLLDRVKVIEVETSINRFYEGEAGHYEIIPWLIEKGFYPFSMFTPNVSSTGQVNYIDVLLART